MIIESVSGVCLALLIDLIFGDPKNKFHPTAWIGSFIARLAPWAKNQSNHKELVFGVFLVIAITATVLSLILLLQVGLHLIKPELLSFILSIIVTSVLLKTTIAIKEMERRTNAIIYSIDKNDLISARGNLSMIVKRKTGNLDKDHVLSGTLESIGENIVDGITGPLFYFGLFGLPGAFVYRTVNTIDSMIGYKTLLFSNVGWFGANCDKCLNYLPSRITGFIIVLASILTGDDWRNSLRILRRDSRKTQSPNAGYPMSALAGALGTKFEKVGQYEIGDGSLSFTKEHVKQAIKIMKISAILFSALVSIPIIMTLSYLGGWIHA
ncbi:MAG: cobalamin biosynthesis protein [Nitrosopumilaceae archaeon]|nr:cobalamin biosynthesis protein [Nitrosopumilaceae archaeon]NIT99967.1 cobalamin biosynthesis protein [Nitrosopumilaceae archaeon]NIU86322.1 cobalamin biosynthesis protein [Nitrosopumilaceae archaeon]NIV65077.1 cobalamin biosynthesis protein [Nitrosopumilaceae archaeon]NIX60570.1 cobalamin biosynthesis protein [Nitrosopumilaceae archaeon]